LIDAASGLDHSNPVAARAELERRLDPRGTGAGRISKVLRDLLAEGKIADRGAPPVRWSRVAKAGPETRDQSIDVVCMSGPGPRHLHPNGEVNFCIPWTAPRVSTASGRAGSCFLPAPGTSPRWKAARC